MNREQFSSVIALAVDFNSLYSVTGLVAIGKNTIHLKPQDFLEIAKEMDFHVFYNPSWDKDYGRAHFMALNIEVLCIVRGDQRLDFEAFDLALPTRKEDENNDIPF